MEFWQKGNGDRGVTNPLRRPSLSGPNFLIFTPPHLLVKCGRCGGLCSQHRNLLKMRLWELEAR